MGKKMKYTIEELVVTFKDHAQRAAKHNKEIIKGFKKNYPGEPLPEHMKEDFMLPTALACICEEIVKLQRTVAVKDLR